MLLDSLINSFRTKLFPYQGGSDVFKLKLGINECTNSEYHSDKSWISSTSLKKLLKDPNEFYREHILGEKSEGIPENVAIEGSLAHTLLLEPHKFDEEYVLFPELRKAGKVYEDFKAANPGKSIVSKPQMARVRAWVEAAKKLDAVPKLLSGGVSEQSLCVELSGINVKVRADYINANDGYVLDIKTTSMPTDVDSFRHVVERYGYDISAALYLLAFEKHYNRKFENFYFVVLGKKDDSIQVYKLSDKTRDLGTQQVFKALETYKRCKASGIWQIPSQRAIMANMASGYEILEV